jgi:hypothetical protein
VTQAELEFIVIMMSTPRSLHSALNLAVASIGVTAIRRSSTTMMGSAKPLSGLRPANGSGACLGGMGHSWSWPWGESTRIESHDRRTAPRLIQQRW